MEILLLNKQHFNSSKFRYKISKLDLMSHLGFKHLLTSLTSEGKRCQAQLIRTNRFSIHNLLELR